MNRIQSLFLITAITVFNMSFAHAGTDYRCTIERVSDSSGDKSSGLDLLRRVYVGKEFNVDRSSGVMIGSLKNSHFGEPIVVDRGSKDNSFKAVTTMRLDQGGGAGSNVTVIVVNEFAKTSSKPFAYLMNDTVYFGKCVHF